MKLSYFNGRGLAESCRVILAVAGEKYEDFRYPLTVLDWSTYNMVKEEFDYDKKAGNLWQSLGKVPYLEVEGQIIFQSKAMERFLANRYNLLGENHLDAAYIDGICETILDLKDGYQKVRNVSPDTKNTAMKVYFKETLPPLLEGLHTLLHSRQENENFLVGNNLSLADIVVFLYFNDFYDDKESIKNIYSKLPIFYNLVNYIGNLDSIKNWLNTRPETPF